uniref:G domain-containing protein n=1 Tax=Panagrolaimus sp. PS1159 TaxID=55785 RepID=A0AC35FZW3_9BILA
MPSSNAGYYIYVVEVKAGKLASKRIKEYGIVDEKRNYLPCDCAFENLIVLCSRCNSFVQKQECQANSEHKFFQRNIRCFKIEHGKEMREIYEPETITVIHQQEIEDSVEKNPRRFDRKEDIRKSSRRNRTPLPSIKDSEKDPSVNEFDDDPELITENIPQRPPPQYQPRFGDFVDPYGSTTKVHPEAEEEPRIEEVKIMPPPRSIPLERKEELPPLPIHADTLHHYQEPEKRYSPITVPSGPPSPTFRSSSPQQAADAIPVKAAPRESKPQTLPREKPKIIPIPVHRYDPPPPAPAYPEPRESKPQVPPHTPRLTDTNRVSPTPLRHKTPSPIQSFDPDFVNYRPGRYDFPPTGRPQDRPLSDGVILPSKYQAPPIRPSSEIPKRPITPVSLQRPVMQPPPPPISSLPKKTFNVLLIGPTGVGKSTWVNALANYLRYTTLEEAKQGHLISVIPAKFTIQDHSYADHIIEYGENHVNEVHRPGESATQRPRQHNFHVDERAIVNVIDTPGVSDTRGLAQDEFNCRHILEEIKSLKDPAELHAIAILLRSNEAKLTASFENAIYQLLGMFPKPALNNIVFVFTYARGTMFRIGDTVTTLTELFTKIKKNHGTEISLKPESVYCVDNEAFRYLIVCATKKPELEKLCLPFEEYDFAWNRSQQESAQFFDRLQRVEPLPTFEVVFYNCVNDVANFLAEILVAQYSPDQTIIETYEVVIDYLIQEGIIRRDPLMRQIIASKKDIPIELTERLFVDKRLLARKEITKKDVCDAIDRIRGLTYIEETLIRLVRYITNIYEEHRFERRIIHDDQESIYHRKRMDESYELLPLINDEPLGFIRGEPTRYSCYSEIREVITTEKVTTTTRTPEPFTERFSTQSVTTVV